MTLEDADGSIKPGVSARVEILIAELKNVVSIPVQCLTNRSGQKVCFVTDGGKVKEQVVQTGAFNDRFVQVLDSLQEGTAVLLNPPRLLTTSEKQETPIGPENSRNPPDSESSTVQESP